MSCCFLNVLAELKILAEAFLELKHDIDKKLDDLFTSDMFMLADGYAGSTTISVSLVQIDHITITTTPLPPNANYTPPVSEVHFVSDWF